MILFIKNKTIIAVIISMLLLLPLVSFGGYEIYAEENHDAFRWYFELCKVTNADKTKADRLYSLIAHRDTNTNKVNMITIDQQNIDSISVEIESIISNSTIAVEDIKQGLLKMQELQKTTPEVIEYMIEGALRFIQYTKDNFPNRRFERFETIIEREALDWLVFFNIFKEATDAYNISRDIKIFNLLYQDSDKIRIYDDADDLINDLRDQKSIRTMKWFIPRLRGWIEQLNSDDLQEERKAFAEYMGYYHLIDKSPRKTDGLYPDESVKHYSELEIRRDKFNDLASVSWAKEYIETLAEEGVLSGVGQGIFAPNNNVKREEFAKMLVGAFGFKDDTATTQLTDVNKNQWYYPFVSIAEKLKIVNGVGNNKFGIGSNITRQDMAVMAYRASKVAGTKVSSANEAQKFNDESSIADYAKESVSLMQQAGIISGMDGGRFAPNENATRAQAAKIIYMLTRK